MATTGWIVFIAALGMMFGLLSVDVAKLPNWSDAFSPAFIGIVMAHMAAVITAFVGGKIIPEDRDNNMRTRTEDKVSEAKVAELNKV